MIDISKYRCEFIQHKFLTLGSNLRKSRHVTGKNVTESDSEIDGSTNNVTPNVSHSVAQNVAKKKASPLLPQVRHDVDGLPPIETRRCPLQDCDSLGHLGKDNSFTCWLVSEWFYRTYGWRQFLLIRIVFIEIILDIWIKTDCFLIAKDFEYLGK